MSVPVLTFFNNKGGVGKTSLVYHLAWMLSEMGKRVVAVDLDPQANLTTAFLPDEELELLWDDNGATGRNETIFQCLRPLTEVGDLLSPQCRTITSKLNLIPGDLRLAGFEDELSAEWPKALGTGNLYRPFRILTAFWQIAQKAADEHAADLIVVDVGPNLGAINRSALIASDHIVIPLAADPYSLQGLRNLGPTLDKWRNGWKRCLDNWPTPSFPLPAGQMKPLGYVVMQHIERLNRPVQAYKNWADKIPDTYRQCILGSPKANDENGTDENRLALVRHYRSLVPMAQEAHKPIFDLKAADGAIGNHSTAVRDAQTNFRELAQAILDRIAKLPV
jgi:chromosome partitioning protein